MNAPLHLGLVVLIACATWWLSTGLILSLVARHPRTYRWSMLGGVLSALVAIGAIVATRSNETTESALIAFACAIAIWGCIEMAFLMGFIVGPSRKDCPPGLRLGQRFKASWAAIAHHEIALLAGLVTISILVAGRPNAVALQTFALMWAMRLSTKLNIFLGVSSGGQEYLPSTVRHLGTYFAYAPMNPLFPISITAATAATVLFITAAINPLATPHEATGFTILATFAGLALFEHWLLVLPLKMSIIWPWAEQQVQTVPPGTSLARAQQPIP